MTTAIQELVAAKPDNGAIATWLGQHSFPIVEDNRATFVWRGSADQVHLRHFIFGLESSLPLNRLDGSDLWHLTVEIPPASRIEYKFEIWRGGGSTWIEDPLNHNRAFDPYGANSVLQGEGYRVPDWVHYDERARPGTMEPFSLHSDAFGSRRGGQIYLPARFSDARLYRLVVVHDGADYLNYSGTRVILDNLIDRLEIPEMVVVFTDSPDRLVEYADDERHARYITEELTPHLYSRFPLRDTAPSRCLMGASFGAVAALSTAYRYPDYWGRLLLQSGSFAFTDIGHRNHRGPLFDPVVRFVNRFRENPLAVSERVFLSCGVYESLIYENRSLLPLLVSTGMQARLVEARDGHNWENWRDRLREGLSWLFPGPLRMVYE